MRGISFSKRWLMAIGLAWGFGAVIGPVRGQDEARQADVKRVAIVVGPSTHPPGTHEVLAGGRVVKHLLENSRGIGPVDVELLTEWPEEASALEKVDVLVFLGDMFPGETLGDPEGVKAEIGRMMARGCGIVCLHFATGLRTQHLPAEGEHPLLKWMGGYFASRAVKHQSVARVATATLSPEGKGHPILRGWQAFTLEDEPYWNNYFGEEGPAPNVTMLVTAMVPPEAPRKEVVGWCVERADGGRGMGLVVPHFYRNWRIDDLRTLVLNGICWAAKMEVPAEGVRTEVPDLSRFGAASVEPMARPASEKAKAKAAGQ